MTVWQRTGIHEETCPTLSPPSFINEQSHEVWGRECVLSKLCLISKPSVGLEAVRSSFSNASSEVSVANPHFALYPFEISLQVKGRIMLNSAWTPA